MRKIILFSSLLCALMFCTTAMAQLDELVSKKVVSVGTTPVTTLETGKWYVMEGSSKYAYDDGSRLLHEATGSIPVTEGKLAISCKQAMFRVTSLEDASIGSVSAKKIKMQFGTGNYVQWKGHNSAIVTTNDVSASNTDVYATSASLNESGVFLFSKNTNETYGGGDSENWMLDRNVNAGYVCAWGESGCKDELTSPKNNNRVWTVYEVTLEEIETVQSTVKLQNEDGEEPFSSAVVKLPCGTYNLKDCFYLRDWIEYKDKEVTVEKNGTSELTIGYTLLVPVASQTSSWNDIKWVSFFTQNGRMHVYDNRCVYNDVKKNPTIDRATFAKLSDRHFWGFVCEDPLTSDVVKIVNKAAGMGNTLYLSDGSNDTPVLFTDKEEKVPQSWIDNKKDEWIIEKGNKEGDIQYFCLKSKFDTKQRINNNALKGFMTTWNGGDQYDKGANIKFTPELETYTILKERALTAPANAIHSLNAEARAEITKYDNANSQPTVEGYKDVINTIGQMANDGVIPFDENAYYYLRDYTPANGTTYVLDSKDGATATTAQVSTTLSNSDLMTYTNINAIWKITKANPNDEGYTGNSEDIGVSKTIGRYVTHVNSGKKLTGVGTRTLAEQGSTYYFVNLGAGQHFLKNVQYTGTGNQAKAPTLQCNNAGDLASNYEGTEHKKNTRDAWYGIPVTSIDVTITDAGYATIYLPFGVTLPEDNSLEAYAVTAAGDGFATLTKVENIPANQGAILKGTANTTYTLTINDNAAWTNIDNKLGGSCMATKVKDDAYVLSKQGEEVGLYKAVKNQQTDSANDSWLNNANKAYLPASAVIDAGARFLGFNFDTVTGLDVINGTESGSEESVVYDLSGRRVRTAQKGLYIVNGKKVIK